LVENSTDKKV